MHHFVAVEVPLSVATEMLNMIRCPIVVMHRFVVSPIGFAKF
jgi:hypothetical protein